MESPVRKRTMGTGATEAQETGGLIRTNVPVAELNGAGVMLGMHHRAHNVATNDR
jgi:hypothetical protein